MVNIYQSITKLSESTGSSVPTIFNLANKAHQRKVAELLKKGAIHQASDDYLEQLKELFAVKNPTMVFSPDFEGAYKKYVNDIEKKTPLAAHGRWVFYPWLSMLAHVLKDEDFQTVRMARNRNLIDHEEQERFYNATVGIGGLSVGNSVALAIVLQGGAKHIKLADMDRLALSNINRIRAGVQNLGLLKVQMTARQIYEINPYAKVEIFPQGLTPKNIEKFFKGLDIVVDELDNIAVKYLIREQAKKHRLAVVMGADNGDNAVVDIERYDLDPQPEFFHGRIGEVSYEQLKNLDKLGIGQTITRHIGLENLTPKTLNSFLEIGKSIVSWPQLGGAALLNGSAIAYCVRKILTGQPLENNRAIISMDEKLVPSYFSPEEQKKRQDAAEAFRNALKM